jgi:hypothetical protein
MAHGVFIPSAFLCPKMKQEAAKSECSKGQSFSVMANFLHLLGIREPTRLISSDIHFALMAPQKP